MKDFKKGTRTVSETNIGMYVWRLSTGDFLMDEEFNTLNIEARRGDLRAMANISQVAKSLGFEGAPEFVEGARRISDEELFDQIERMKQGLTPDPYEAAYKKLGKNL